ncbi:glycerophosphodiester phosphodiesterase family protein [Sphingomonas kyeonggiensis]|uniref:Glycerophosphoryl diester phosphodiesterase n=1 Tax=Sphingomonas kyeonggiensis TaxID=1268553 RepID=A0A7W6JWD6_9SPHN|nr:glycerophosphodiester phosphodiesterase family protein [Sphingomonas kyeonggiensis]MBB4100743.1 glycerophosphoryl diester phosphodiesterase [Sphingomonas kyeonggiensis]
MIAKFATAITLVVATPAMAAPVCGTTSRIAELQRAWADPHGSLLIASHRGGHLKAPENSLAAIDEAVAAGADAVETDVQVSADGVPFILHDQKLDRTTDGTGRAADKTYAELRKLRLKGSDLPPPTLLEFLTRTCGRVLVDLDMKTDRFAPVIAVIQELGMIDQVMLFDADSDLLRAARAIEPKLQVMTRFTAKVKLDELNRGLAPVRIVHADPESLDPASRDAIRQVPARIWENALGELDMLMVANAPKACPLLKSMLDLGVNAIQTDRPALLREYLRKCA